MLAFDSDIGTALKKVLGEDSDTEAKHLANAAKMVRKEMLSVKSNFQGTFEKNCQEESVQSSLISLVKMILYWPNIQDQLKSNTFQVALTIAQLLQFNFFSQRREENASSGRHNRDRETSVPLYVGLSAHALTRKRELVDSFYELGISISYDRVLSISTDIGNEACRRFEGEGVLCPFKLRRELFTTAAVDNMQEGHFVEQGFHSFKIPLQGHVALHGIKSPHSM